MSIPHGCTSAPCPICHGTAAPLYVLTNALGGDPCPVCHAPKRTPPNSTVAPCACISARLTCGPGRRERTHLDFTSSARI